MSGDSQLPYLRPRPLRHCKSEGDLQPKPSNVSWCKLLVAATPQGGPSTDDVLPKRCDAVLEQSEAHVPEVRDSIRYEILRPPPLIAVRGRRRSAPELGDLRSHSSHSHEEENEPQSATTQKDTVSDSPCKDSRSDPWSRQVTPATPFSVASSSVAWRSPENVMFVVDFDDTIFPTTWMSQFPLFDSWMRKDIAAEALLESIGTEAKQLLITMDLSARAFILAATQLGKVACVTLSRRPWVSRCMLDLMPRLAQTWQDLDIEVVYAREMVIAAAGTTPATWAATKQACNDPESCNVRQGILKQKKRKAMLKLFQRFYHQGSWKNVISFGDGDSEKEALRELAFQHINPTNRHGEQKPFRVKTLKLKDRPDCEVLITELQSLQSWIPSIVCYEDDIDIDLDDNDDEDGGMPLSPTGNLTAKRVFTR